MDWKRQALLWAAWMELNEIRARDGVPYNYAGFKSSVSEEYFSAVVDELAECLGDHAVPWPQPDMKTFLPTAMERNHGEGAELEDQE